MNLPKALLPMLLVVLCGSFSVREKTTDMVAAPLVVSEPPMDSGTKKFMYDLGERESNNTVTVVSRHGYLGKYQFHQKTLHKLGIWVSDSEFLHNESLQDEAMLELLRYNNAALSSVIHRYSGHWFRGVFVTRSGVLAGAHLVGPGGVMTFFDSTDYHFITHDSNGTTVQDYMIEFAGYRLRLH